MRRWLIGITLAVIAVAASPPARAQVQQGSLTTAAADCGNPPANSTGAIFVAVGSSGGATVTASGTWSGTLSFFGTGDGGVTYTVLTSLNNSNVSTTTGNGTWQFNPTAYSHICVAFTTASSGTAVVTIRLSTNSAGHGGGGGGGGGGIGGTVSSPFLPYASGADALSDSEFSYDTANAMAFCFAEYDSNDPPCIWAEDMAVDSSDSSIGLSTNGVSVNDINDGVESWYGGGVASVGNGSITLSYVGAITAGVNGGFGGSLTLNDATSGSPTLTANADFFALTPDDSGSSGLVMNSSTASSIDIIVEPGGDSIALSNSTTDPDDNIGLQAVAGSGATLNVTDSMGGSIAIQSAGGIGTVVAPQLAAASGQIFVCVDTTGMLVSSATACVGTK
jgi:hypothetical protein